MENLFQTLKVIPVIYVDNFHYNLFSLIDLGSNLSRNCLLIISESNNLCSAQNHLLVNYH